MTATIARLSPYENRLKLVENVLIEHSSIDAETASSAAVHILHALDSIPEKVR
ncbi:DUF6307 family protein [Mycolicibacterium komossense]|jgi:hypothetical protein|uniref:Uncharacterized protein n=1 Tax=Mycolicibacterium komossense TaxID=1779 RepID=A0ABT3CHE2_9MYCO|nr:DUF6307 family protein [Mycolicibacterium komossense]MCV7228874.1 hypothetical protein [Mycolicibacterium komossense]